MIKMELTKIDDNNYYVSKHLKSFYYNNYEGQIIDLDTLLIELKGYSQSGIVNLDDIILLKNKSGNQLSLDKLYNLLDSLVIVNKLLNKLVLNFISSKGLISFD